MSTATRIALLLTIAVSVARANYFEDGCKDIICDATGTDIRYPNPRDKCSFCCCYHGETQGRPAEHKECPIGQGFSEELNHCVPMDGCPRKPSCEDIVCEATGQDQRLPDPNNICGFCCCYWDGGHAETKNCPFHQEFSPEKNACVWSERCPMASTTPKPTTPKPTTPKPTTPKPTTPKPTTPKPTTPKPTTPKPTTPKPTTPKDDCEDVYCPECYHGMNYLVPNPNDVCSFCCCTDNNGPVKHECPPGEEFSEEFSGCIPSNRCGNHTPPPPPPPPGDFCLSLEHRCPVPENPTHVTLFAYPHDSRFYCKCDWGKIHLMMCSPGTTFNEPLQVCT